MTMTPEQIYWNFHMGDPEPLRGTAKTMRDLADSYGELVAAVSGLRSRQSGAWTGNAALAAAGRSDDLVGSLNDSVELMRACVRSHDAQEAAFTGAKNQVREMPPVPERPGPLDLAKEIVEHGPSAPFGRIADYRESVLAYQEAAEHNNAVMEEYHWRTADNKNIPADYPTPVLPGTDTMSAEPADGMTGFPVQEPTGPGTGLIGDPTGDPEGSGGGGAPGGGGVGVPGGGGGGGAGGVPDVSGVDVRDPDVPPVGEPPPGGGTAPSGGTGTHHAPPDTYEPPPKEPPPRQPGPPGPGNPPWQVPGGGGPGGPGASREDGRDERPGNTFAARAGSGADGTSGFGWPLSGADRVGADAVGGGHAGRGAGGPGGTGSPGGAGANGAGAGTTGARMSGQGGAGMGTPLSRQREEEDREHTRPEYLIEPDPEELFGSAGAASSPVIGASWRPEYGEETDD